MSSDAIDYGVSTRSELVEHLAVDRSMAGKIVREFGLANICGLFPWVQVWRKVHNLDLPPADLIDELKRPLLSIDGIAELRGQKPDTLRRARREKRIELPRCVVLGPRTYRWRPVEIQAFLNGIQPPCLPHLSIAEKPATDASAPRAERAPPPSKNAFTFAASLAGGYVQHQRQ